MEEYISKDEAKSALMAAFAFHSYAGPTACAVIDKLPAAIFRLAAEGDKTRAVFQGFCFG